ncbi:hypothetical protein PPACK8108_LOCUS25465 [Phakopsora pachyrhizi]|uniref:Nuclear pore complex protein Nup188 n=1 Tax=Phakopsora pachyrhizi TaxID=170000 RepID=A0AAV0BU53_PHAPC|nr:hypothetical protein PPACK8108_LOCUS25465 [Phakopsora pachyrhizi]
MCTSESRKLALVSNPIQVISEVLSGFIAPNASAARSLRQLLRLHEEKLKSCYDPYPPSSSKSREKLNSGQVVLKDGDIVKISGPIKDNVFKISDALNLDEVEALVLWLQFLHRAKQSSSTQMGLSGDSIQKKKQEKLNEPDHPIDNDSMARLTDFYFEERRNALIAINSLLHIEDNQSSHLSSICSEFLASILSDEMPSMMLQNYIKRTQLALPEDVRISPRKSTAWTRQLIIEQKLLLEVVFLLFYGRVKSSALDYLAALSVLKKTSWGQNQACLAYFDEDTSAINQEASNILSLIALQVSHIEDVSMNDFHLTPEPVPDHDLTSPATLRNIYDLQLELLELHPQRIPPIALAWTFVLHKMTMIYLEHGIPPSHSSFAELILPSHPIIEDEPEAENQSLDSAPLYQKWTQHILSSECQLFRNLGQLAISAYHSSSPNGIGSSENNGLGYLQFEEAMNAFALLFRLDRQHAIAVEFWRAVRGDDVTEMDIPLASGEAEYFEVARSRFPLNFALFTKLCRSLSGFSESRSSENPNDQVFCADSLVEYVDHLVTLTEALPTTQSALLPLTFEPALLPNSLKSDKAEAQNSGGWIKASRPIWISPTVKIPKDTLGKVVSGIDQKPVIVCWHVTWSAWEYWGSLVLQYAGCPLQADHQIKPQDAFGPASNSSLSWAEDKLETDGIVDVLRILTTILECRPELGSQVIHKMVDGASHQAFIQAVFNIIENSFDPASNVLRDEITQASLRLISALLPIFPGAVWTLVRGSQTIFPDSSKATAWNTPESSRSILKYERLSGNYGVTTAILDLVHMLFLESGTSGLTTTSNFANIKVEVLQRALNWICEEVWPGFQSWKYLRLENKFKIANKCCLIFNDIASAALKTHFNPSELKTDIVTAHVIQLFSKLFLKSPTSIILNPMITIIATDKSLMEVLNKSSRKIELEALIQCLGGCLLLAKNLLSLRPSQVPANQPCLLERLLLSQSHRKSSLRIDSQDTSRYSALHFVAHWSLYAPHVLIAKDACDIFSLLCTLSKDWPSDWPSISSAFGDPTNMSRYLHDVAQHGSLIVDTDESGFRSTLWDLLAVILRTQPPLEAILVTGSTSLPGLMPPASPSINAKTPLYLGIKCFIKCFENNDQLNLSVGLGVLHFLYTVYKHVNNFSTILNQTIEDQAFIDRIVEISTSLIISPEYLSKTFGDRSILMDSNIPDQICEAAAGDMQVKHFCNELICKSYATKILTVLLQLEMKQQEEKSSSSNAKKIETALMREFQKTSSRISELICPILETMASPELQSEAFSEMVNRFPNLDLDSYRRVDCVLPHEKLRLYGKSFVYDYDLMKSRIEGMDVSSEVVEDVTGNIITINWNLSAVDAQLEVTRAWEELLHSLFQQMDAAAKLEKQLSETILKSAKVIAEERRGGDFMVHVHSIRTSILLILLQALPMNSETTVTTIKLLENAKNMASSERFPIIDSIKQKFKVTWHTDFLKFVYMVLRRCSSIDVTKLSDENSHLMINTVESLLRSCISILETVLTLVLLTGDAAYEQDLNLSVSIFSELMNSPVRPPIMNWAHRIHDLCQPAFSLLNRELVMDDKDPKFFEDIIRLFMSLALHERLAEYLASEGLIPVLLNLSLTPRASQGLIEPVSPHRSFERSPTHQLWCSILALLTSLSNTLCYSQMFMVDEIGAFARLYSAQLLNALSKISISDRVSLGVYGMSLTLAGMEEMELASAFLLVISSKPIGSPRLSLPESYRTVMLASLQTLAHCLSHPSSTAKWLEHDTSWKSSQLMSSSITKAGAKGPVVIDNGQNLSPHVQEALLRMLQTSRNILQTLISYTRAINVLTREVSEWAVEYAIMSPTRSIVAGDLASIGTLFELAETSLDIYRLSAPQDVETNNVNVCKVSAAVLEGSLLLASTQLALWLCSSMNQSSWQSSNTAAGLNSHKESDFNFISSSPRLKREILSDLAPDLIASIEKSLNAIKSTGSRTNDFKETSLFRPTKSLQKSMISKRKKAFGSFMNSTSSETSNENPENKSTGLNGVEQVLVSLKSFAERFLSS